MHPWGYSCILVGAAIVHSLSLPGSRPVPSVTKQSRSSNTKLSKLQGLKYMNRRAAFILRRMYITLNRAGEMTTLPGSLCITYSRFCFIFVHLDWKICTMPSSYQTKPNPFLPLKSVHTAHTTCHTELSKPAAPVDSV